MKICIYGDTLSGWVASAKLAETGNKVTLYTPHALEFGLLSSKEPRLVDTIIEQQTTGRLETLAQAALPDDHHVYIFAADGGLDEAHALALQALQKVNANVLLLVISPFQVGGLDQLDAFVQKHAAQERLEHRAAVVGMPLFIREGSALMDFSQPANLIISGNHEWGISLVQEMMRPFVRRSTQVMVVPHKEADLIQLGINGMLATRLSFMNEMAALAEKLGVDIEVVRRGLASDPRIGGEYLYPGCGFGGRAFSRQLLNFAKTLKEELDTSGLIDKVLEINESQREILFRKLWRFFKGDLQGRQVGVWGAAFKPGTASLENSPVQPLLKALWAQGCKTCVYDPMAGDALKMAFPDQALLTVCDTAEAAAQGADALVLVTAWDEFWSPDFVWLKSALKTAVIFDGRNIYNPDYLAELGFRYYGIGRGSPV